MMLRQVASTILVGGLFWGWSAVAYLPLSGNYFAHDPSTLAKDGSRYYYFRTDQGISINWSSDLRTWNGGGRVFPSGPPAWTSGAVPGFTGFFWAPDVAYFNGKYHVYYSCSTFGSQVSAIGLVTSPSLTSPAWSDQGPVIQSSVGNAYNCIDPCVLMDTNGSVWMTFGSYWNGVYLMQLDPVTGLRISPGSPLTRLADNSSIEASCLYQHGGYYYLFVNWGSCCNGINSTYNIRVGRSTSVTGPYLDRSGVNMVSGGGTVLLESNGRFIGPGHAGIFMENGTNWFTYHYYDGNDNGNAKLGLAQLEWGADGWPALTNDWCAFYTFEADAREHRAQYNGTLRDGATVLPETGRGKVLNLDGNNDYCLLPISVANASTFAAWVKWNGGGDWQRILDFGDGTGRYFFLTPRANDGRMRFAITTSGGGNEQMINAPSALSTGSWQHVAVTLDGLRGVMYLNGAAVATNPVMTIRPWQVLARSNYIGESQWSSDPMFGGRIDSFRVFGRPLSAPEIRDLAWAPPTLAHRYSFNNDAKDSIGMAHGALRGNATITNNALKLVGATGDFVDLPGGLVSGSTVVTIEFWASFGVNGDWSRVFDFGNISGGVGQNFLFFSPHTSLGGLRLGWSAGGTTVNLDPPGTFDNQTLHVVCIADPLSGNMAIYTNGVLRASQFAPLSALSSIGSAWSFIGRSLWSTDAWLNGTIDEFRIYDGRLTPEEIAVNYQFGPDALAIPIRLTETHSPAELTLSWPAYAAGFNLETTDSALGDWQPVEGLPLLLDNKYWLTVPTSVPEQFFQLRR